jgi:hypothetical protein
VQLITQAQAGAAVAQAQAGLQETAGLQAKLLAQAITA